MDIIDIAMAKKLAGGGGGGGDSDFTIANVTITINDLVLSSVPYLTEYDGIEFIQGGTIGNSGDFQVPLYKGNAVFTTLEPLAVAVTGNITPIVEGQAYLITGDGTITLNEL